MLPSPSIVIDMDLSWVTSTSCAIAALTVGVAVFLACSLRRLVSRSDRQRSTQLTSSDRAGVVVMTTSLVDGLARCRPTGTSAESLPSSLAVATSSESSMQQAGEPCTMERPLANGLECDVDDGHWCVAQVTCDWSTSRRIGTHALDYQHVEHIGGDEEDQTFVSIPDRNSTGATSDNLSSTMSATAELRQLRAQLELERDRRAVAEEWSAFLATTLRAYLAAREAYDRRPLTLSGGSVGNSSTDTDDDVPARGANDRRQPTTAGRECDVINAGGKAGTNLKRQFQRSGSDSPSKSTFHGDGSLELNYDRWLAKYRAEQRARSTSGTDKVNIACHHVRKPESDDEVTDWERTVSYNETILRSDRQPLGDASNRRKQQSTIDRDRSRPHQQGVSGASQRYLRPAGRGSTTNDIAVARTTQDGQKNELSQSGNSDRKNHETQKTKTFENPQEKRESNDSNYTVTVESNSRDDNAQLQRQRSSPGKQPVQESKQSNENGVTKAKNEKQLEKPNSDVTRADPSPECSKMPVASRTQSRQRNVSRTASSSSSASASSLLDTDEPAAAFTGTKDVPDVTDQVMTSVARDEPDDEDPEIWKLSVRDRVDSWRRKKPSTMSTQQQQQQQHRHVAPSNDRVYNIDNSAAAGFRLGSSIQDEEPSATDVPPGFTSADRLSLAVAQTVSSTEAAVNSTSGTSMAAVDSSIDVTSTTTSGDKVVLFEPVAKVGDTRALFERIHRQTSTTTS